MDFSGFIGNIKTHEMEMRVREERDTPNKKVITFKATPLSFDEEESRKTVMRTLPCSLGKWARCFIKREDKATFGKEDIKGDSNKRRRWVLAFIARRRAISLQITLHFKPLPSRTCIRRGR